MFPILFSIGSFNVYSFGFFLFLSFVISTFIIWKYASSELMEEEYLDLYLYTNIFALVTARIAYILFNFKEFGGNILKYFVVRETPGLNLIAGILGGLIFLYWITKKKKYDFWHLSDIFCIAFSFSLFLSKIGEQLGGAGFGRETTFILGIKIVGKAGRYFPTEFIEAILFLLLTIILVLIFKYISKVKITGFVTSIFFIYTLLIIFLIEFLKDYQVYLYRFSMKQIAAFE